MAHPHSLLLWKLPPTVVTCWHKPVAAGRVGRGGGGWKLGRELKRQQQEQQGVSVSHWRHDCKYCWISASIQTMLHQRFMVLLSCNCVRWPIRVCRSCYSAGISAQLHVYVNVLMRLVVWVWVILDFWDILTLGQDFCTSFSLFIPPGIISESGRGVEGAETKAEQWWVKRFIRSL